MKLFGMRNIWMQENGVLVSEVEEGGRRVQEQNIYFCLKKALFFGGDIFFFLILLPKTRSVL